MQSENGLTLEEFLQPLPTNLVPNVVWMGDGPLRVYMRRAKRLIGGEYVETLDLANMEVDEPSRGCGRFTRFLVGAERLAMRRARIVFVENVLSRRFQRFFERRGYTKIETPDFPEVASYYLEVRRG